MPCVQVVKVVCHTPIAHVDLKPTLCELINLPLEVIYLAMAQIFLNQKQKESLAIKCYCLYLKVASVSYWNADINY
jgi:hypothetical protein